jgi:hypothetical protein
MKEEFPVLKRLGPIPFWRGERRCMSELEEMYRRASRLAADVLAGRKKSKVK